MIDFIKGRRSCRSYRKQEISDEKLKRIIKAGLLAPSGRAKRPWEFILIKDSEILEKLSNCRKAGGGFFLKDADAAVVILADPEKTDVWTEDCSIAASYIQLEAHSIGIGSCWVQVRNRIYEGEKTAEEYIKEILSIPEKYKVECMIGFGYPEEERESNTEKDVEWNKLHMDKF